MSKRILFIGVESDDHKYSMNIYERRDIGYLASYLKEHGHQVKTCFDDIENVNFADWDSFNPEVICLPVVTHPKVIDWVKSKKPDAIVCRGTGSVPYEIAANYLKYEPYLDFVVHGGEVFITWVKLIEALELGSDLSEIKGILYRINNDIIENPGAYEFNINDLPYSDLESTRSDAYITTSFGCIGNCSFCAEKVLHKKWQGRSIDKVIDEIQYFVQNGVNHIHFADASLEAPDVSLKRLKALCNGIIDRGLNIYFTGNFRPDFSKKADFEVMNLLKRAGLYKAFVGVESGSNEELILYNKRCTVEDAKATVELFEKHDIYTETNLIMFNPFSTPNSLRNNVDMLEMLGKANFSAILWEYNPIGGGNLCNKTKNAGLLNESRTTYRICDDKAQTVLLFAKSFFKTLLKDSIFVFECTRGYIKYYDFYERTGQIERYWIVKKHLFNTRAILHSINVLLCSWFRKLIVFAENGFDMEKASLMSYSLLNPEILSEMAKYLELENKAFFNELEICDVKAGETP